MSTEILEPFGPDYPALGSRVAKFRRISKHKLTAEQSREYSDAITSTILTLQRQALQRDRRPNGITPSCASGTWHNNADGKVGQAIREQHRRSLLAYPDKVRRERTDAKWREMYAAAMTEKRQRERETENASHTDRASSSTPVRLPRRRRHAGRHPAA
jgi:hypothetical protein